MTIDEIIKTLELAKAEVEWNYPMDYYVAIDEAIEIIKNHNFKTDTLLGIICSTLYHNINYVQLKTNDIQSYEFRIWDLTLKIYNEITKSKDEL